MVKPRWRSSCLCVCLGGFFFFQAEDGIRDYLVTGVQTCALPISLLGTSPPIWRRLLVSADVTLAQLHDVLQATMGWEDGHMHEFSVGQRRFGRPDPEGRAMGLPSVENERTVRLSRSEERRVGKECRSRWS